MTTRKPLILGSVFGRLTVTAACRDIKYYVCACSCGETKRVRVDHLRTGKIRSCGCLRNELSSSRTDNLHEANKTHGLSKSDVYDTWRGMKTRCGNKNNSAYSYYGGRGLSVCKRWLNSFENFISDMGPRPDGFTLERKNNALGYSPKNCVWASRSDQQNNRRVNRRVVYNGKTYTVSQLAELTGVHRNTITLRIDSGLPIEKIVSRDRLIGFSSKLSPKDVESIRASSATGVALAKKYGVTASNISAIRTGRSWK